VSNNTLETLKLLDRVFQEAVPKFNWGASFLDANAIDLLNRAPPALTRLIAELEAQQSQPDPTHGQIVDIVNHHLTSVYVCTRVWSAWGVGTMSEDDFSEASETDLPAGLAGAILDFLRAHPPAQPEQEPVAWMSPNKERLEFSRKDTVYGSHTIQLYTVQQTRAAYAQGQKDSRKLLVRARNIMSHPANWAEEQTHHESRLRLSVEIAEHLNGLENSTAGGAP
jgi:hypothetical protein